MTSFYDITQHWKFFVRNVETILAFIILIYCLGFSHCLICCWIEFNNFPTWIHNHHYMIFFIIFSFFFLNRSCFLGYFVKSRWTANIFIFLICLHFFFMTLLSFADKRRYYFIWIFNYQRVCFNLQIFWNWCRSAPEIPWLWLSSFESWVLILFYG